MPHLGEMPHSARFENADWARTCYMRGLSDDVGDPHLSPSPAESQMRMPERCVTLRHWAEQKTQGARRWRAPRSTIWAGVEDHNQPKT